MSDIFRVQDGHGFDIHPMQTWYYYTRDQGDGYWTTTPPSMVKDRYIASIVSALAPLGPPTGQTPAAGQGALK